jgi:hypothetical protein
MTEIIGIVGSLTGLLGVCYSIYSKKRDADLKEKQFALEKRYKISKEKYQELMEEKIDLYIILHNLYLEFIKASQSIGRTKYDYDCDENKMVREEITKEKIIIDTFFKLKNLIEKKPLLISEELEKLFLPMLKSYEKNKNIFDEMWDYGIVDEFNSNKEWRKLVRKFYEDNENNWNSFWAQLKKEIREMRNNLN